MCLILLSAWRHDTQHHDTHSNNIQHNDTQYYNTQHNDTQYNIVLNIVNFVFYMTNSNDADYHFAVCHYNQAHYAECHCTECCGAIWLNVY